MIGILIATFIFVSFNVNAFGFGVTQPETIVIGPGENRIVDFSVQTGAGDTQDIIAILTVFEGKDIVELIENNEYFVPGGGETTAKIKINIPSNAKINDKFKVGLLFKTKPADASASQGNIALGQGLKISFDVLVSEPKKETPPLTGSATRKIGYNSSIAGVIIIAIGILIYLLINRRKGKKRNRKRIK